MKKTRTMYSEIIKNEKLITEMKKVLQMFPFGVIMWPASKNNKEKWFINKEFEKKFSKIKKDLNELSNIDIVFTDHSQEVDVNKDIQSDLNRLLKHQQHLLKTDNLLVEKNIKIRCQPDPLSRQLLDNEDETVERI